MDVSTNISPSLEWQFNAACRKEVLKGLGEDDAQRVLFVSKNTALKVFGKMEHVLQKPDRCKKIAIGTAIAGIAALVATVALVALAILFPPLALGLGIAAVVLGVAFLGLGSASIAHGLQASKLRDPEQYQAHLISSLEKFPKEEQELLEFIADKFIQGRDTEVWKARLEMLSDPRFKGRGLENMMAEDNGFDPANADELVRFLKDDILAPDLITYAWHRIIAIEDAAVQLGVSQDPHHLISITKLRDLLSEDMATEEKNLYHYLTTAFKVKYGEKSEENFDIFWNLLFFGSLDHVDY